MKFALAILMTLSISSAMANEERDARVINATITAAQTLASADLSCTKTTDCVVIALGSKACGGPNGFLVASTKNATIRQIRALAKQSEALEAGFNLRYGIVSNCMVAAQPSPSCVAKVCQ